MKISKTEIKKQLNDRLQGMQRKMETLVTRPASIKAETVTEMSVLKDILFLRELIKDL